MADSRLDKQLNAIEALIAEQRDGMGIAELDKALALRLSLTLNRRTLQRRAQLRSLTMPTLNFMYPSPLRVRKFAIRYAAR